MGFFHLLSLAIVGVFLYGFLKFLISCWVSPTRAYLKLRRNGFGGPTPNFPLGNLKEMKEISARAMSMSSSPSSSLSSSTYGHDSLVVSNDIHSTVFPYFAQWQNSYGKVFIYWLGTEPFLYIADPEFLKRMSSGVLGKSWGKPTVFKQDREPMFGNGLVMVEGDDWVRHRHVITPAFSPANLKAMSSLMVESATQMLDRWTSLIESGDKEIDVEKEIIATAGEIIAKTSFGIGYEKGREVFEKLRAMQMTLFKTTRHVGVPFGKFMSLKQNLEATKLGKQIDSLLLSIIESRRSDIRAAEAKHEPQKDLLGLLLEEDHVEGRVRKALTTRELVDECKTFFFGGHETTALALSWTLLLLAMHPEWQEQLREEIRQIIPIGDEEMDFTALARLKKMGWVMNEVLRLYSPAPNVQRQTREDIKVGKLSVPNGTNVWIDVVAMHHDVELWGDDVHVFRPDRFRDDLYGGCNHKMGYLPFGFGGRMCVGRNLSMMEYKIVLTMILTRFSFSLPPSYSHSPCIMLSLRPRCGLPLLIQPL